jgi:lysophospholipase L1-like esterase
MKLGLSINLTTRLYSNTGVGGGVSESLTIQERFLAASAGTETVNYIVSGDSTRDNSYNQMIAYYDHQLTKANVTLTDNASSGQSGQDWGAGTDSPNLSEAIAATPGTGAGTILEFSFGINDYKNGALEADVKNWLKTGLQSYMSAKPDAAVVLSVPVATAIVDRNTVLSRIYSELGAELSLPVIDTYTITSSVHGNTAFYNDGTHPNRNGSIRIVNYIFDQLLPSELYGVVDLDSAFLVGEPPEPVEMAQPIEAGYWSSSTGAPVTNTAWRRMQEVAVEPNFVLRIQHQGNRFDVSFLDANGVFVDNESTTVVSGQSYREVIVPTGAWKARINVSSLGSTYDTLGDVPSVKYGVPDVTPLTMAEINNGLSIRLVDNSIA